MAEVSHLLAQPQSHTFVLHGITDEKTSESAQTRFDLIYEKCDVALDAMKGDLKESFSEIIKANSELWHSLTHLKATEELSESQLRQDKVEFGLSVDSALKRGFDAISMKSTDFQYDGAAEYDTSAYLSELIARAHSVNPSFIRFMKQTKLAKLGQLKFGPVKTHGRCKAKALNDYSKRQWPKSACVIDIIRCSVTFDGFKALWDGIEALDTICGDSQCVENDETELKVSILRCKNGFAKFKDSGDVPHSYCDVKYNVICTVWDNSSGSFVAVVGEIQLLFKEMIETKRKIHEIYEIMRHKPFVDTAAAHLKESFADIRTRLLYVRLNPRSLVPTMSHCQLQVSRELLLSEASPKSDRTVLYELLRHKIKPKLAQRLFHDICVTFTNEELRTKHYLHVAAASQSLQTLAVVANAILDAPTVDERFKQELLEEFASESGTPLMTCANNGELSKELFDLLCPSDYQWKTRHLTNCAMNTAFGGENLRVLHSKITESVYQKLLCGTNSQVLCCRVFFASSNHWLCLPLRVCVTEFHTTNDGIETTEVRRRRVRPQSAHSNTKTKRQTLVVATRWRWS